MDIVGSDFGRNFFKITSAYPVISIVQTCISSRNFDFETALISSCGNYKGNIFYSYLQHFTNYNSINYGCSLTIFNPNSITKTATISKWGGSSYNISPFTFSIPPDGVYIYGGTDSTHTGYYKIECLDGEIMAFQGNAQTSDNDNWFEYGIDWNSGKKVGNLIYGKYGPQNNKLIITGIAGYPSYMVYTMSYPTFMNSNNIWNFYTSGTVGIGNAIVINPPNQGLYKIVVSNGNVHVGAGSTFLEINVADGDYVPGTNNYSPLDTKFYFSTGPKNYSLATGATLSVVCPQPGTTVSLSPTGGSMSGNNPTTAEDMAIVWQGLGFNKTYQITSNNPVYCFVQGPCGGEKSISMSSLLITTPLCGTYIPTATATFTSTNTATPTTTNTSTFTYTLTNTYTPSATLTFTPTTIITQEESFCLVKMNNYPNPSQNDINIIFQLCNKAWISIKIYTVSGEIVKEITMSGKKGINIFSWNGKNKRGREVASGIYIYSIEASIENKNRLIWGKISITR